MPLVTPISDSLNSRISAIEEWVCYPHIIQHRQPQPLAAAVHRRIVAQSGKGAFETH
jgi:hypothetical protein